MKAQYNSEAAELFGARSFIFYIFLPPFVSFQLSLWQQQSVINVIMINCSTEPGFTHLPNCNFPTLYFRCSSKQNFSSPLLVAHETYSFWLFVPLHIEWGVTILEPNVALEEYCVHAVCLWIATSVNEINLRRKAVEFMTRSIYSNKSFPMKIFLSPLSPELCRSNCGLASLQACTSVSSAGDLQTGTVAGKQKVGKSTWRLSSP